MAARRGNIAIRTIIFIVVTTVVLIWYFNPGPVRITISKETTHILGPVNEDGTVDYIAYLNAKHSEGVTKENNAAIPLIEIFGPNLLLDNGPKICEILEIDFPSKDGKHFTNLNAYIKKALSDKEVKAWSDRKNLKKATTKPWNTKQHPIIAEWLQTNDDALNATLIAIQRTAYYIPGVASSESESLAIMSPPTVILYATMANALCARAMLKLDSGDTTGVWADLTAARHLARRVGSGYTVTEGVAALAIERRTCFAIDAMAGSEKLGSTQARAFLTDMQRMGPLPDIADSIDQAERFLTLSGLILVACENKRRRSVEWDRILLRTNAWYDSLVTASRQKTFKARAEALADHKRRFDEFEARVSQPRSFLKTIRDRFNDPTAEIGDTLIPLLLPTLVVTWHKYDDVF